MTAKELERFWKKIRLTPTGCWAWLAHKNDNGYGSFQSGGRTKQAHRVAYEHFVGPIPDGLELDHKCRRRNCANPAHLEAVTHHENVRRGRVFAVRVTHCPHGHEYTEANTRVFHDERNRLRRKCRTCHRLRSLKRYRTQKKGTGQPGSF